MYHKASKQLRLLVNSFIALTHLHKQVENAEGDVLKVSEARALSEIKHIWHGLRTGFFNSEERSERKVATNYEQLLGLTKKVEVDLPAEEIVKINRILKEGGVFNSLLKKLGSRGGEIEASLEAAMAFPKDVSKLKAAQELIETAINTITSFEVGMKALLKEIDKQEPVSIDAIKRLEVSDLLPEVPKLGETLIVLQRNAKDIRDPYQPDNGPLDVGAIESTLAQADMFFDKIFSSLSSSDKSTVDIMVMASDAVLSTPEGMRSGRKRAVDTAQLVIDSIRKVFQRQGVSNRQLLNNTLRMGGGPIEVSELRDLSILEQSPAFVDLLRKRYGTGIGFWDAYENDVEKKIRKKMGAEGPEEIADRVYHALSIWGQISKQHHLKYPNRRLIIWAVSHYDTISPFIKKYVLKMRKQIYLPVAHGGGVILMINQRGKIDCLLRNRRLAVKKIKW
ncbi:MAG: hypothetical protein WCV90_06190 [Candidatus Woesearchaeota archaeon]